MCIGGILANLHECHKKREAMDCEEQASYQRNSSKGSREHPRQKQQEGIIKPEVHVATKEQKNCLKQNQRHAIAA